MKSLKGFDYISKKALKELKKSFTKSFNMSLKTA